MNCLREKPSTSLFLNMDYFSDLTHTVSVQEICFQNRVGGELQHGVGKSGQRLLKSALLLKKLFYETVTKDAYWEKRQKQCKSWLRETPFLKILQNRR